MSATRLIVLLATIVTLAPSVRAQQALNVGTPARLRLMVDDAHSAPTLRVVLPGREDDDRSIVILFPEHITAVVRGDTAARHMYLWQPGNRGERPAWRRVGQSLEYVRDLPGEVSLTARATLDSDGVRLTYQLENRSRADYAMITAVSDPRMTSILHDERLERTWVHYASGFELIAAELPSRLTMPLPEWLPARYRASFTWPVPQNRVERRSDATVYTASRAVDQPFIATVSTDRAWVVASVSRTVGSVWTNPALTCQHVDSEIPLAPGRAGVMEVKLIIMRGTLENAFARALRERAGLK